MLILLYNILWEGEKCGSRHYFSSVKNPLAHILCQSQNDLPGSS